MIVPSGRLLFLVALVAVPAALAAAWDPRTQVQALLAVMLLVLLAAFDAIFARGSLEGITVELPDVARLSVDREGAIDLEVRNAKASRRTLRLGLALPEALGAPLDARLVVLPAGTDRSRVTWPLRPGRRGRYRVESVHLEGASPLGLWAARRRRSVRSELRVYPSLLAERRRMAALFLNRGDFGVHAVRQMGKGREFEKLREYIPGDGYDDIHWKATAKRGRPVTKVYQIERTQEVYVVIDASRLSARPQGAQTALDRYLTAALVLGLAAERQGDLYGLLTFTDRVRTFVRARSGKAHYGACRDALYTLEPEGVSPDFDEVATFLRLRLRRRALLVFLTALDDPITAEGFTRAMQPVRKQHLVLVNVLAPPGVRPLFSDGDVQSTADLYERLGGHDRWRSLRELEAVLKRSGISLALLDESRLAAEVVAQYLGVKRRQAL